MQRLCTESACSYSGMNASPFDIQFPTQYDHLKVTAARPTCLDWRKSQRRKQLTFCVHGVLSPLLANILLDDLDRELERRGHRFARYADDLLVLVKSERAGQQEGQVLT